MPNTNVKIDFSHFEGAKRQILIQLEQWHWQIAIVENKVREQQDFDTVTAESHRLREAIRDRYQANEKLSRREPMAAQRLHRRYLQVLLDLSAEIVSVPSRSMAYYDLVSFKDHLLRDIEYIRSTGMEREK
ncbi:hypothetical protein [Secundilactobacillus folii]|uniref:Uncharacterized protein n=1 Tax=Secundilactobacillus folii TaxID=2678357 RepID=A0A7X3C3Q1_9LACO|nr:hypothetical protein [Secundilactobacillus folii]MTV82544.1 hypothetical protein [Secundilactobacillus folii]